MTENGCSEDLPCSQQRIPSARFAGSCFCGRPNERRTARRTTIGALSRTSAWQAGVSYSATFCTWARSTPRRRQGGERPSRFSTTMRGFRGHWRCSPKIDVLRWRPTRRSFSFACRTCGCVGRGNGAPVGWPGSCGGICGWSSSGPSACRRTASTRWDQVLHVLVSYRLIAPGSEWKLHRDWFGKSAMADLLGADFGLAEAHKLRLSRLSAAAQRRAILTSDGALVRPV